MTGLPLFTNWKNDSYNSILVIINRLTKIVYYKPVKIITKTLRLAEIIIDRIVQYHGLSDSIINVHKALLTSNFWLLFYYKSWS